MKIQHQEETEPQRLVPEEPRPREDEAEEKFQPLGQEVPEVVDEGAVIGEQRLERPSLGDALTAFIGGMSVSFGAVAMVWAAASVSGNVYEPSPAHLFGALAFPIGFIILLVGKSELFTENFFLPVTAMLERRGTPRQLVALWGTSLVFNLLGGLVFAALVSQPNVLDSAAANHIIELAEHKVHYSFRTAFVKAIFAGWLMTLLTWLVVAAEGFGPRLFIIWSMGTLIVLAGFNHVIISAAEIFMAMFMGAAITVGDWLTGNFIPALLGNVIGGVVFVTLLFYIQARTAGRKRQSHHNHKPLT